MIPEINEIGFPIGPDGKKLATLDSATVTIVDMGDRTISTQVKIDGDIVPDFNGWELEFNGERFVLPSKEPQAVKDNTTRNSLIDLNFRSWVVMELQRYFFMSLSMIDTNVGIADQYKASVNLPVEQFVTLFNKVLQHYYGNKIRMDLYEMGEGIYSTEPVLVEINYTKIWDVLIKFYELFGLRWRIEKDNSTYVIKVGYDTSDYDIDDHDFEYGYQGGLVKFERQVADEDIRNIILGRGGEKNLPYRYFKRVDENNPEWAADPDAIYELKDVYFDRLRDANFRSYVQGWKTNPNRDHTWGDETPAYDAVRGETDFAYKKGHEDLTFDPVEYVKDQQSIDQYGEHWGHLDDNDEIFPTIQGRWLPDLGRADEVVDVSDIDTDDVETAAVSDSVRQTLKDMLISLDDAEETVYDLLSEEFTIPEGSTGSLIEYVPTGVSTSSRTQYYINTTLSKITAVKNGVEYQSVEGLEPGTYRLKAHIVISTYSAQPRVTGTFGYSGIVISIASNGSSEAWKPTFDIWIKDIWNSSKLPGETDDEFAFRIWGPILGDRVGNQAKICFSSGPMASSQDYEFIIAEYPHYDPYKSIYTKDEEGNDIDVESWWRITLYKSSAEFDATGLYIPTTVFKPSAGDHFFFVGIDMPFDYVDWAEKQLRSYKQNELNKVAEVAKTWVINFDKVRINTLEDGEYERTLAQRMMAGAKIRTTDKRFTNGDILTLYIQTLTYTWNVPSEGSPYIYPDIDAVLSDKVVSRESPVSQMQNELDEVKDNYVSEDDVESAVRRIASRLYLKKTGESDSSQSPTTFASTVTSENFRPGGVGGRGWGIYRNNYRRFRAPAAGSNDPEAEEVDDSVIEVDQLVVRKEMQVNSLVVNQLAYVGGREIISAAKIEVSNVVERSGDYVCYFDQKQDSVKNLFVVGDIAYGQVFTPDNDTLRYYKMYVTATDINSITLSKTGKDGSGSPQVGDVIVQYGNRQDERRQYVIIRDVIGGGYERMLCDLSATTSAGKEYYFAGILNNYAQEFVSLHTSDGEPLEDYDHLLLGYQTRRPTARWFVGDLDHEYAEWKDGVLNIKGRIAVYKNDGTYVSMAQYIDDNDVTYLKAALNESTIVQGGLILTSLIQLGQTESSVFNVYAGINGMMSQSNIAAWFGGPMADKEATPTPSSYAKSLFRFNGSGYLASGNISWDQDGYGHIPGISWDWDQDEHAVAIRIDGSVKLGSVGDDTVTDMITLLRQVNEWFGEDSNGDLYVKKKTVSGQQVGRGLYTYGFLTGGGVGSSGGGGGGTDLARVWASLTNATADAYANTTIHPNHIPIATANTVGGIKVGTGLSIDSTTGVLTATGASVTLNGVQTASASFYAPTVPGNQYQYLMSNGSGAPSWQSAGSIANNNNYLVTGGAVYSYLRNNYLPLSGGQMNQGADIEFSQGHGVKDEYSLLMLKGDSGNTYVGEYNISGKTVYIQSGSTTPIYHRKGTTNHAIWDTANLENPCKLYLSEDQSHDDHYVAMADGLISSYDDAAGELVYFYLPTARILQDINPSDAAILVNRSWVKGGFTITGSTGLTISNGPLTVSSGATTLAAMSASGLATFTGGIKIGTETLNLEYDSNYSAWKLTGNLMVTGFLTGGGVGSGSGGGGTSASEWYNIKMKRKATSQYEVAIENYTTTLNNNPNYRMFLLRWRKGSNKSAGWHAPALCPSRYSSQNRLALYGSWTITGRSQEYINGTTLSTVIDTTRMTNAPLKFKATHNRKLRFGCAIYKNTGVGTYGWQRISNIAYVELFIENSNGNIKRSIRVQ